MTVGLMLGSAFPMFVAWGPGLGFLYNDAYVEILGAKHPAALGQPFQTVWSEIWTDIEPLIQRAMAGESTFMEDLPLCMTRRGKPEDTSFTFSCSPVREEDGRVAGIFCCCVETTVAKRREVALRESEEMFRVFAQAIPNHVWRSRPDGHLDWFSDSLYSYLSEEHGTLDGAGWIPMVHPDDLVATAKAGSRCLATGDVYEVQFRLRRSDGAYRHFLVRAEPVRDENGQITKGCPSAGLACRIRSSYKAMATKLALTIINIILFALCILLCANFGSVSKMLDTATLT